MINKWRYVTYLDDGVSQYQCLKCGQSWSCRSGFGPFCTWCGTKWEGEQIWYTEERQERNMKRASCRRRPPQTLWSIQSRTMWDKDKTGDWKPWIDDGTDGWKDDESTGYDPLLFSAKTMAAFLADKRRFANNDHFMKTEYRVVMRMVKEAA